MTAPVWPARRLVNGQIDAVVADNPLALKAYQAQGLVLIGVCTTRAGQTSTYWATSLAWSLAEQRSVTLVDIDMEGGTIADLLYLSIADRSIGNCFGDRPARAVDVEEQAVAVPQRPNLRVVPGLRSSYGYEISDCLRRVGPAIAAVNSDVVIADLGHPLAHPGLRSPRTSASTTRASSRASHAPLVSAARA